MSTREDANGEICARFMAGQDWATVPPVKALIGALRADERARTLREMAEVDPIPERVEPMAEARAVSMPEADSTANEHVLIEKELEHARANYRAREPVVRAAVHWWTWYGSPDYESVARATRALWAAVDALPDKYRPKRD